MNKNGYIDYTEFLAGCMKSKIYLNESYLQNAFDFFDKDKDGLITFQELKSVLQDDTMHISDDDLKLIISEVDFNKDEKIDYKEFLHMMESDLKVQLSKLGISLDELVAYKW
mmetsp:Transcript_26497/g.25631  ORF Transcript_26497/g.25631 Transcript_26497/m.25631 type:complete len:112 (+) Transcript_26497:1106-1441(+)